jgi:AcrR family transcriptional regulator
MKTPSSLRDRQRALTRDAILESAANAFNLAGPAGARMEDIAAGAGIAVGTLYNYFHDRRALVAAVLQSRTQGLLDALDETTAGLAASRALDAPQFGAGLRRFVATLTGHCEANRALMLTVIDEGLHHGLDASAVNRQHTVATQLMARAGRLLGLGIEAGLLRRADASLYAAMLLGVVRSVTVTALVRGDAGLAERSAAIVDVFLGGAADASSTHRAGEALAS